MVEPKNEGKRLYEYIKAESEKCREAPLDCFIDFLESTWMDNSEAEAIAHWTLQVKEYPWNADDALYCLDWVLANPPDNLADLLKQHGWIQLTHRTSSKKRVPFTHIEILEWLRQMRDRFKKIYDEAP